MVAEDQAPVAIAVEDSLLQAAIDQQVVWLDRDLGDALCITGTPSRYTKAF